MRLIPLRHRHEGSTGPNMRRTGDHIRIDALQAARLDGTSFCTLVDVHESRPTVLAEVATLGPALWRDVTENPDLVGVVPTLVARGRGRRLKDREDGADTKCGGALSSAFQAVAYEDLERACDRCCEANRPALTSAFHAWYYMYLCLDS